MAFRNEEEEELYRMGPGSPSGEVFRRYWLPVETTMNLGGGRGPVVPSAKNPLALTVMGEHLVLFRDATGKPGLLAEHCSHRGTSLYFGRVEDEGLRCLYHGWMYDREGRCIVVLDRTVRRRRRDRRSRRRVRQRHREPLVSLDVGVTENLDRHGLRRLAAREASPTRTATRRRSRLRSRDSRQRR